MNNEEQEQQLRIEVMTLQIQKLKQEIANEPWKLIAIGAGAAASILTVGILLGRLLLFHQ